MNNKNNYSSRRTAGVSHLRKKQLLILLFSVVSLLVAVIGGTLAFIFTKTDKTVNTFTPTQVSCEVNEDFNGTVKSNVAVKNTGTTDAYIRATVNITWMKNENADDQTVSAKAPQKDIDYSIEYLKNNGWLQGNDGYWYYQSPVAPNGVTKALIESCKQLPNASVPKGCHLSVEIAASAIQSLPETTVSNEWNVEINNGKIASVNGNGVTGE